MIELQDNAFDIIAEAAEANPYHVDSILNACGPRQIRTVIFSLQKKCSPLEL